MPLSLSCPPFTPGSVIDRIRSEHEAKDAELELMICDLTDFDAIKSACDDLKAKGWPIHVLLNNAGIQAPYGHMGQKSPGGFEVSQSSDSLASSEEGLGRVGAFSVHMGETGGSGRQLAALRSYAMPLSQSLPVLLFCAPTHTCVLLAGHHQQQLLWAPL